MKIGICNITDVESHHVGLIGMPAMMYEGMALIDPGQKIIFPH